MLGKGIPKYIVDMPLDVLKTPMGAMIGNMVSGMNSQANANSTPLFDPRSVEGANNNQAMNFGGSGTSVGSGWDKNKGKGMVLELSEYSK